MLKKNPSKILNKLPAVPVSSQFGFERGTPIDRYFIEKFLQNNENLIKGDVMEIGDNVYTKQFGSDQVTKSLVLHAVESKEADIVGDLSTGRGIKENMVDCFICTQTLLCIFDIFEAVKNTIKLLKPGGHLLLTVPGITQISRYDMERWGHYWSFTDLSIKNLYSRFVPEENITVKTYGNAKLAAAFLYGLALEDINQKDLNYIDNDYQLVITAVIKK